MLSDRDYMSNNPRRYFKPEDNGMKCVFTLIIINAVIFLIIPQQSPLYSDLALWAQNIREFKLYELVTAMFLHGGFGHILFNMWGVYLFGSLVAPHLGTRRFLALYLISGLVGNLLWLAANWNSPYPVVGASGAVFGILIATAMLEPNQEFIMLLFPLPLKAKTMAIVYAAIEIISELSIQDNIAHLAHLGGLVGAYIFLKYLFGSSIAWDPLKFFSRKPGTKAPKMPKGWSVHDPHSDSDYRNAGRPENYNNPDAPISQRQLDEILDKISHSGINSLTGEEREILKRARQQMRQ